MINLVIFSIVITCFFELITSLYIIKVLKKTEHKRPWFWLLSGISLMLCRMSYFLFDIIVNSHIDMNDSNIFYFFSSAIISFVLFSFTIEFSNSTNENEKEFKTSEAERMKASLGLKEIYVDLIEVNDKLSHQNKELDEFVQIASHDLKEPIRKITAFCSMISEEIENIENNQKIKKYIEKVNLLCGKIGKFVGDLLSFSYAGRGEITIQETDINDCIEESLDVFNEKITKRNIKIDVKNKMPIIQCDKQMITHVFMNLISNAIKFTKKNKSPLIEIWYDESDETYSIKDNGIGVKEDKIKHLFVGFRRLNPRSEFDGTGIGLSICKKIIERHGGKIWAESKFGEWTCFKFKIGEVE